jgi:MHS family proline/betaine transporter-like MFS transporter
MPKEAVLDWGWRIPFVASVVFCIAGWFLRRGIIETEAGLKAASIRPPLFRSLASDWRPVVQTFGIVAMTNAAYYLTFTYAVEQRKEQTGDPMYLLANTLVLFFVVLASKPLGGWLSDKVGRRRLMMTLTVAMLAMIYLSLRLMLIGSPLVFALGQSLLAVPIGMALGLQGAMVVEIFPLRTRVTSMSFAYSITLALAGGSAPFVSTWLIKVFGNPMVPAYYIMLYGVIGLALMLPMKETNTRSLED